MRLWVLYQVKSMAQTIEELIGVLMWNDCKSTTTIKKVAMELITYWDSCKAIRHGLKIYVIEEVSTRSSLIGD